MQVRCEAITQAGARCQLDAPEGATWCYVHDPAFAEERKRNASRAGRAGGNGRTAGSELAGVKRELRKVIGDVIAGRIGRSEAAVAVQGYNVLVRVAELERRIKEQEELAARLAVLENTLAQASRYGLAPRGGAY